MTTFAVTKNTVKVGPISVNIRNGHVNYDGRTLTNKSTAFKVTALVGAALASVLVATQIVNR